MKNNYFQRVFVGTECCFYLTCILNVKILNFFMNLTIRYSFFFKVITDKCSLFTQSVCINKAKLNLWQVIIFLKNICWRESHVTCHYSLVKGHMSHFTHHLFYRLVKAVGEGFGINRPSVLPNWLDNKLGYRKVECTIK